MVDRESIDSRLVYLEVDDDKVWEALGHLDDLRQFAAITRAFADRGDS